MPLLLEWLSLAPDPDLIRSLAITMGMVEVARFAATPAFVPHVTMRSP